MPEELLHRIRREISDRKEAARAAFEESHRLQAALAALAAAERSPAPPSKPTSASRTSSAKATPRTRAPRGANRRRLLEAVADRPGATAGQLAQVTGIARPTAATTLAKLVANGQLERVELPGNAKGFKTAQTPTDTTITSNAHTDGGAEPVGEGRITN